MSDVRETNLCNRCQHPLRPNAKFCSNCGTPCSINRYEQTSNVSVEGPWRLIICYSCLVLSILLAWFWIDIHNWYVDLIKDYGSHTYRVTSSAIFDVFQAFVLAVGSFGVFHFDRQNKKKMATISAVVIFPVLLISEIIYLAYITNTMGDFASMMGWNTSLSPLIILDIVYPAILLFFVLWNNKIKKISFAFPIVNIICFFLFGRINILITIASTLGLSKHWKSWIQQNKVT